MDGIAVRRVDIHQVVSGEAGSPALRKAVHDDQRRLVVDGSGGGGGREIEELLDHHGECDADTPDGGL